MNDMGGDNNIIALFYLTSSLDAGSSAYPCRARARTILCSNPGSNDNIVV
jgi:hypothetical protein